jgi:transcriptional regulator with XRE-family HTH domain
MFSDLLRAYRELSGFRQEETARKLQVSLSTYKKLEQQLLRPQRDFAQRCDELYGTPRVFERGYEEVLAEPFPADFGPRVIFEDRAAEIIQWEMRGVPGLLQTQAYARTVIRACRPYDPAEVIEEIVRGKFDRQGVLDREQPVKFWTVIAEAVLWQMIGGPTVMREQLDHLVASSHSARVVIQVLPFSATDGPGVDGPITLFELNDGNKVAYLESWDSGRVVEDPKDIAVIETALNMVKSCALSPADSRRLMIEIRESIQE